MNIFDAAKPSWIWYLSILDFQKTFLIPEMDGNPKKVYIMEGLKKFKKKNLENSIKGPDPPPLPIMEKK